MSRYGRNHIKPSPHPITQALLFPLLWVVYCLAVLIPDGDLHTRTSIIGFLVGFIYLWGTGWLLLRLIYGRHTSVQVLVVCAVALVTGDQILKLLVSTFLPEGNSLSLIDGFLSFNSVPNHSNNVVLSLLDITIDSRVFHVMSKLIMFLVAGTIVLWLLKKEGRDLSDSRFRWGITLVVAGAISSVLDSAVRGFVLDLVTFGGFVSFDLKDLSIMYGIGLFFTALTERRDEQSRSVQES